MLHKQTKILTATNQLKNVEDLVIGEPVATLYGTTEIVGLKSEVTKLRQIILEDSTKIYCSQDQKFLVKKDFGYIFAAPKKFEEIVSFTHLMSLVKIQQVNELNEIEMIRVSLYHDYSVLINGLFISKT